MDKKVIMAVLSSVAGVALGAGVVRKKVSESEKKQKAYADKHLELFLLMNQWVRVKQENRSIADYLQKKGFSTIAIYGMSYAGETLFNELEDSMIKVKYGIDKMADSVYSDIDIVSPESELEEVDAIIVTAITFFESIEKMLMEKVHCPILSLEDILYEV